MRKIKDRKLSIKHKPKKKKVSDGVQHNCRQHICNDANGYRFGGTRFFDAMLELYGSLR